MREMHGEEKSVIYGLDFDSASINDVDDRRANIQRAYNDAKLIY